MSTHLNSQIITKWIKEFDSNLQTECNKIIIEYNNIYEEEIDFNIILGEYGLKEINDQYLNYIKEFFEHYGFNILIKDISDKQKIDDALINQAEISDIFMIISNKIDSFEETLELFNKIKNKLYIYLPEEKDEYKQFLIDNIGLNYKDFLYSSNQLTELMPDFPIDLLEKLFNLRREKSRKLSMIPLEKNEKDISIGILTALKEELRAIEVLVINKSIINKKKRKGNSLYFYGEIPSNDGKIHHIVYTRTFMGNNMAAIKVIQMVNDFPNVETVLMVGIAGGVPNPEDLQNHVRLGDVVVSNQDGIIQYDFLTIEDLENYKLKPRHKKEKPNATFLEYSQHLQTFDDMEDPPWKKYIIRATKKLNKVMPCSATDILINFHPNKEIINHPDDPTRIKKLPKIFSGPIASSNILLKDDRLRNRLREKYNVKAVEMEGSGVMDATWASEVGYFIIRGICDYCNQDKNDLWHDYAAIVAAAYARALIELLPVKNEEN